MYDCVYFCFTSPLPPIASSFGGNSKSTQRHREKWVNSYYSRNIIIQNSFRALDRTNSNGAWPKKGNSDTLERFAPKWWRDSRTCSWYQSLKPWPIQGFLGHYHAQQAGPGNHWLVTQENLKVFEKWEKSIAKSVIILLFLDCVCQCTYGESAKSAASRKSIFSSNSNELLS